jgi:hypothetical protein
VGGDAAVQKLTDSPPAYQATIADERRLIAVYPHRQSRTLGAAMTRAWGANAMRQRSHGCKP